MNLRIKQLVKESGGEFWQRIESDGVLNKEAYITFDPPQSLEKFAELIVGECVAICQDIDGEDNIDARSGRQDCAVEIREHFGVDE